MKRTSLARLLVLVLSGLIAFSGIISAAAENITVKVGYAYESSFVYQGSETVENNTWTQLYAENGIDLSILYNVDASQRTEKLMQSIMSGDYPDVMNVDSINYIDWAKQGVFTDLTGMLDKYLSDEAKEYYEKYDGGATLNAAKVDGKIYALPVINDPNDPMMLLWIRKDWLDKLGYEIPKTIDQFVEIARAFTENDPDGNGQKDTYGIGFNGVDVFSDMGSIGGFFEMYGACPGTNNAGVIPFIDHDGKAVYGGGVTEDMTKALTLLHSMYASGYIPVDFITSGRDQVVELASSGKIGMYFAPMYNGGTTYQNALATQPKAEFIAIALPGPTEDTAGRAYYANPPATFFTLSSKCETPEALFTMFNLAVHYLASPDKLSQEEYEKYNGLAGKYTGWQCATVLAGVPLKNLAAYYKHQDALKTGDTSKLNAENLRDYNAMQDYLKNKDRRTELSEAELAAFNSGLFFYTVWGQEHCGYRAIVDMIAMDNLTRSAYNTVATAKMVEHAPVLERMAKEAIVNIIVGNQSVDSYQSFLETWNQMGGSEITAEADAWYQSSK